MNIHSQLQLIAELLASDQSDDAEVAIADCVKKTKYRAECIRQWAIVRAGTIYSDAPLDEPKGREAA